MTRRRMMDWVAGAVMGGLIVVGVAAAQKPQRASTGPYQMAVCPGVNSGYQMYVIDQITGQVFEVMPTRLGFRLGAGSPPLAEMKRYDASEFRSR